MHQGVEIGLAAIQMVETPGRFTGEFHMAGLVFAHRHPAGFVNQDISGLQQRVAQETVGAEVFVLEFFLLVFVGGHTF